MIRYLLILIIIFLGIVPIGAQNFFKGSINWQKLNSNRLYFENAVYRDTLTNLPYFEESFKLSPDNIEEYKVQFSQIFYEELSLNEIPKNFPFDQISDSINISHTQGMERKIPILRFSFVPIRKNPHNGKLERAKYFVLEITSESPKSALKYAKAAVGFEDQSILSTGVWYKFLVKQSGIHKITYNEIKTLGINDPENVRIFGNGGKMLPEAFKSGVASDPKEIPVLIITGTDGRFNEGDYILFYAEGPVTWRFDQSKKTYIHEKNRYSDNAIYFITSQPGGKKVYIADSMNEPANLEVTSFDGLEYHEENLVNLIRSGRNWYGEYFAVKNLYEFPFTLPNLIYNEPLTLSINVINRSEQAKALQISQNSQLIKNMPLRQVNVNDIYAEYGSVNSSEFNFTANADNITIKLSYNGSASDVAWLDYFRLISRRNLIFTTDQLSFRDSRSIGYARIANFRIGNAPEGLLVWDVTDIHNVAQVNGIIQNSNFTFKASTSELKEYVAFDPSKITLKPIFPDENKKQVPNQNLHSLRNKQFIIISHPDFQAQAEELAEIHRIKDNLSTIIVTPEQVYNEFSSGIPDPASVRNFMRMLYERGSTSDELPRYLLLFGDGSYDNKTPLNQSSTPNGSPNKNFIVTYQSENSLYPTSTYVTDDYFGLLDENENITTGLIDVGIGRIPIQTAEEAEVILKKIKKYISSYGNWRNSISFIGDDEDNNIHMWQADQLANYVINNYPNFNVEKIQMDAYELVSTASGSRFPNVNKDILNQINNGLLILNYTGHGGETGLAKERIIEQSDIKSWRNDKYFMFITATCDFTRFDDYEQTTAGENVLLNPNGGGIALLSTNRVVYSGPNFVLNQQFYKYAFARSKENPSYKLGDITRLTKNNAGGDINKLSFMLFGDPALSLAIPKYQIVTDSINHKEIPEADTLKAFGHVSIKGRVTDELGNTLSSYNGIIYPTIYDKKYTITSLSNNNNEPFVFQTQNRVLFKGKSTVKNGTFEIITTLPRDINYNYGFGRISYYSNDSSTDAAGYFNNVTIGGLFNSPALTDKIAPDVRLYMNDTTFINGGITDEYPTLIARVSDLYGINPGGNSIGHDITVILDNNSQETIDLNSYFETDLDNTSKGTVKYKFPKITPGKHTVKFKIWDISNNSAEAFLDFIVPDPQNITIQRVYNYPNPSKQYTTFFFEHNIAEQEMDVTIELFDFNGRKIKELTEKIYPFGYTGSIRWNFDDTMNPGMYLFRIVVRSQNQMAVSKTAKMVVIP